MNDRSDQQLLQEYAHNRSDSAFAELVRRHLNLVYSAALRRLGDAHLAEDVAQGTFTALAQNAPVLAGHPVLSGWLHRTTQNLAANLIRTNQRRQTREQEAVTMNQLLSSAPADANWQSIAPHLDAALDELESTDRDVVMLRYFEKKSAREAAIQLGLSEAAAQKRVSRAVDRLREFFAKRGVTVGASGLAVVISANAVQAAPVGLALTISTAALTGTTLATTATVTATKAIAMTALQKTVVTATIAVLAGAGIYEARQASQLREQVQALQQQQAPLSKHIAELDQALFNATNQLAALRDDNERLNRNTSELLKLRGEVGLLRKQATTMAKLNQPPLASAQEYYKRAQKHYSDHNFEAQFEDLTNAIELDPNLAEAYYDRAALYASQLPKQMGGIAKAIEDYTHYLKLKPNDYPSRSNRALYYSELLQYDNAIADYTIIIEGDTDYSRMGGGTSNEWLASAFLHRGRAYHWGKKDYPKAISDYSSALQLDPRNIGALNYRGTCYRLVGELEKAQADFDAEKALRH